MGEAKAKANAKVNTSETEKGEEMLNGSSLKKKRGRPKKNKTEDEQDEERIASSAHSPSSPMVSSQTASHQSQYITNGGAAPNSSALQAQAEENLVSSSSPNFYESEPKVVCVAVQTPNKLLKSLVASKVDKGSKPTKEHDAQIAAQA